MKNKDRGDKGYITIKSNVGYNWVLKQKKNINGKTIKI